MRVTNITVSFLREKQPAKFEKAQPAVEMTAVLDDGENHLTAARDLMMDAASVVYAGIGYGIPDKVADALANIAPGITVILAENAKAEVKAEEITAENFPGGEKPAEDKPKRGRGRPKGSTNKAPKAGSKAADVAAKAGAAATKAAEEEAVPGGDPTSTAPSVEPQKPASGDVQSAEPGQADEAVTAQMLEKMFQDEMSRPAATRRITMPKAKAIIHFFGVSKAIHLTDEQATEAKAMLDKEFAAHEAAAAAKAEEATTETNEEAVP